MMSSWCVSCKSLLLPPLWSPSRVKSFFLTGEEGRELLLYPFSTYTCSSSVPALTPHCFFYVSLCGRVTLFNLLDSRAPLFGNSYICLTFSHVLCSPTYNVYFHHAKPTGHPLLVRSCRCRSYKIHT